MFSSGLMEEACAAPDVAPASGLCLRVCVLLAALLPVSGAVAQQAILRYDSLQHPVRGQYGLVASQRALASQVGADILQQGGNAVDAAVATSFALAVVLPRAGNIGGGGFAVVHIANSDRTTTFDFRERAPAAATRTMFLAPDGSIDQQRYRFSHLATGVPGSVAGLHSLWSQHGSLDWSALIEPAIALARVGHIVSYDFASALATRKERLTRQEYTGDLFFKADRSGYQPGDLFVQSELAETLRVIADAGPDGFYKGRIARLLVEEMQRGGGLITLDDLSNYTVTERAPVLGEYNGYTIASMPPPSSGGVHLVQMLNVLGHFPLAEYGWGSARTLHVLAETMKRAYADRSVHMGDPDFSKVPVDWLTSAAYAQELAGQIKPRVVTPSARIKPGVAPVSEGTNTTHLSVMDAAGNAVALTYTLNFSFGNGIAVPGAGFLLNNEMTDFSASPGQPDGFGLITGEANSVAPGKRPLSAMTPTLVLRDGRVVLVTGSPGGSRIINTVLQNLLHVLTFEDNLAVAVHKPRIHHQWMPDALSFETGFSPDTLALLKAWGHPLQQTNTMGSVQAVGWDGVTFFGASDPRRPGAAAIPAGRPAEVTPDRRAAAK